MPRMVEVVIDSVRVSLTNQQRIVVLREVDSDRYLPIWIGPYEAEAITIALQEIEVARPQTHDLLKNVLQALNARLLRVEVLSLRDDVYYGNLVVEFDNQILNIDSRTSDALALAARVHVPIYVAMEVLDIAGIRPEEEKPQEPPPQKRPPEPSKPRPKSEEQDEDRLSVFEDFLEKLDIDDLGESSDKDENPSDDDDPSKQ